MNFNLRPNTFLNSLVLPLTIFIASPVFAQDENDPAVACQEAVNLIQENDIDGALEEARWCVETLEQLKQNSTLTFFPDEVDGFLGGEIESQKIMGMAMIERTYVKDGKEIEVSLMGGGPASVGLAALAQLGMNMGEGAGGKKSGFSVAQ